MLESRHATARPLGVSPAPRSIPALGRYFDRSHLNRRTKPSRAELVLRTKPTEVLTSYVLETSPRPRTSRFPERSQARAGLVPRTKPTEVLRSYVPETSPSPRGARSPNEANAPHKLRSAPGRPFRKARRIKHAGVAPIEADWSGRAARRGRAGGAWKGNRGAPRADIAGAAGGCSASAGTMAGRLDGTGRVARRLILKQLDKMTDLRREHEDRAGDDEHSRPEDHGRARQVDDHPLSEPFVGEYGRREPRRGRSEEG